MVPMDGTGADPSKRILVMGHEHCGVVSATIDDVELGNITEMLTRIRSSVEAVKRLYEGASNSKTEKFVHED